MADKKITQLPTSTVPLVGTEVLPIVQSGTTKQVSVANLTAGRAISATEATLTTGNLVIGTSGKGIDFSATPGTGTSELFADYEEGTWTPTILADSGSVTLTTAVGTYTKVGRMVTINANVIVSTSTAMTNVYLNALPFTSASNAAGSFYGYGFTVDVGTPMTQIDSGTTLAIIHRVNGSGSVTTVGPTLKANTAMWFSLTYFV